MGLQREPALVSRSRAPPTRVANGRSRGLISEWLTFDEHKWLNSRERRSQRSTCDDLDPFEGAQRSLGAARGRVPGVHDRRTGRGRRAGPQTADVRRSRPVSGRSMGHGRRPRFIFLGKWWAGAVSGPLSRRNEACTPPAGHVRSFPRARAPPTVRFCRRHGPWAP